MIKIACAALCLSYGLGLTAYAKEPSFVAADETRVLQILMAPAAPGSDQVQLELADLHRIEANRTLPQMQMAQEDDKNESIFIYRRVMGDWFSPQTLPVTAAFSARVKNDEGINTTEAKLAFARVRPYNQDKSLHPICPTKTKNDSYPSGHATAGYLMALTLIDMFPDKRDAILARAQEYANNRLVCGVHFPSDIAASRLVAYSVHAIMANKPQYQQELAAARAEVNPFLTAAGKAQ